MVSGALVSVFSCSDGFSWPEKNKITRWDLTEWDDGRIKSIQLLLPLHRRSKKQRLSTLARTPGGLKTRATLKLVLWERDSHWKGKLSNKTTLRPDCCWRREYSQGCYAHATTGYQTPGNTHFFTQNNCKVGLSKCLWVVRQEAVGTQMPREVVYQACWFCWQEFIL